MFCRIYASKNYLAKCKTRLKLKQSILKLGHARTSERRHSLFLKVKSQTAALHLQSALHECGEVLQFICLMCHRQMLLQFNTGKYIVA
jgi:hypothetical protein